MVPIYLCAWHVLKAWQVYALEKIKDVVVCWAILDDCHVILYAMSNLGKNIKDFKACGKRRSWPILNNIRQKMLGHDIFGLIIPSLVSVHHVLSYPCHYFLLFIVESIVFYVYLPKYVNGALVLDLWMVGFWQVLHSNQDTQTLIESYHSALRWWFSLETKRLGGRCTN